MLFALLTAPLRLRNACALLVLLLEVTVVLPCTLRWKLQTTRVCAVALREVCVRACACACVQTVGCACTSLSQCGWSEFLGCNRTHLPRMGCASQRSELRGGTTIFCGICCRSTLLLLTSLFCGFQCLLICEPISIRHILSFHDAIARLLEDCAV